MNRIMLSAMFICGFTAVSWCQTYYESSGQTAVFTLRAGTKTIPSSVNDFNKHHQERIDGISFSLKKECLVVNISQVFKGNVEITIFDISGREMYKNCSINNQLTIFETSTFTPGVYAVLVKINGRNCSHLFSVNR